MTDLSIIIVSWNVADLLRACLTSIERRAPDALQLEIIVVDSGSQDGSAEMVRQQFPHIVLLPQSENVGFVRCNNIGLAAAQGRCLLLLNPDTEMIGDALAQMVNYLQAHPEVGVVGPHTLNTDGTTQSTRRRFPTLTTAFFESTWLQRYAPQGILARYYVHDAADDKTVEVDWVQGSALLVRREVYEQIGGLDEGYIMYSEELDWCRRAKAAGWRVLYLGSAYVVHHGGKSSDQAVPRRHIHFNESKLRYFRKYHGWTAANLLRVFLLVMFAWQLGLEAFKSLIGHKRALRQERIRTYWQVLRSGLKVT